MGHTGKRVEPVQLQQTALLCFCEDIYLQKVQKLKFLFFEFYNQITEADKHFSLRQSMEIFSLLGCYAALTSS